MTTELQVWHDGLLARIERAAKSEAELARILSVTAERTRILGISLDELDVDWTAPNPEENDG
jgi:hypothetical protein